MSESQAFDQAEPKWKRTLYTTWAAQLFAMMAFSFVMPFIPFYIRELGVTDEGDVAIWAGILGGGPMLVMAVAAPIWGMLADRYGRKIMVERAMFGGAIILSLMGIAGNIYQLFALRLLQGAVTGTVAASMTLASSVTPRARLGYSMGLMQMAVFSGACIGPLLGGIAASHFGYRIPFVITGGLLFASGLLVMFGAKERFSRPSIESEASRSGQGLRDILSIAGFTTVLGVLFSVSLVTFVVTPIFPLFVEMLNTSEAGTESIVGMLMAATGIAGAVGASLVGRVSDRTGYKRMLALCLLAFGVFCIPQAFVQNIAQLLALRILLGLISGGTLPTMNALIAHLVPRDSYGKTFGITASVSCAGRGIGPLVGGLAASSLGLRPPFVLMGVLLLAIAGMVALRAPQSSDSRE